MRSHKEFTDTYTKYYTAIRGFLRARVAETSVADDLAGEVFYKAWRGRDGFRANSSSRAWLFQIARNTLIDYWRKRKDIPMDMDQAEIEWQAPTFQQALEHEEASSELATALDTLPGMMKSVTVLRFIEGRSAKEVAKLLHTTEGNVRVIQFRALSKLRELLHDEDR